MPLNRLLRDAISYAAYGVIVGSGLANASHEKDDELRDQPGFAHVFRPEGSPLIEGEILRQPQLANTLKILSGKGLKSFYTGVLADCIAMDLKAAGSLLTREDLARHAVRVADPLTLHMNGVDLYNHPPPSQGMISLLILAIYDQIKADRTDSFDHVHRLVEATKLAMQIARAANIGDPSAMPEPACKILEHADLTQLAAGVDPGRAAPWAGPGQAGDTVWFAAADADGRVVSAIQSLYFEFGSGVVLPETGFVWQNRGSSFTLEADAWNALEPGRKPFHTLNPAIAKFHDGRVMAYGAIGGEGQPQSQAAIFTRYAHDNMPLQSAVSAPRWLLGRTWGASSISLKVEERFDSDLIDALKAAGHDVEISPAYSDIMGHAGAIVRRPDGVLEGQPIHAAKEASHRISMLLCRL